MHSKGNHQQNEKTIHRMGENCKWCNQQGVNFQNIQTAHTTQYQKNKTTNNLATTLYSTQDMETT